MTNQPENHSNVNRVLVITYKYYPQIAPRAFRWSSIIREWVQNGVTVDVICAPLPNDNTDFSEFPELGNVYQVNQIGQKSKRNIIWRKWFSSGQRDKLDEPKTTSNIASTPNLNSQSVDLLKLNSQSGIKGEEEAHGHNIILLADQENQQSISEEAPHPPDSANQSSEAGELGYDPYGGYLYFGIRKAGRLAIRLSQFGKKIVVHGYRLVLRTSRKIFYFFIRGYRMVLRATLRVFRGTRKLAIAIYRFFLRGFRIVYRFFIRAIRYIYRALYRVYRRLIKSYIWPDYAMPWILPATLKARRLLRANKYDTVITVSWPISPHVVGMNLNRKMKRKGIKWLVDIGDPFSFNTLTQTNNFKRYARKNKRFEERLLAQADTVTVTTIHTQRRYEQKLDLVKNNFIVIPPLISIPEKRAPIEKPFFPLDGKIRLVYTGSLRRNNRRPEGLLRLFAAVQESEPEKEMELHFFGDIKQCTQAFEDYQSLGGTNVFTYGVVPKELNDQVLNEADVLVNIGNRAPYQLPSKLVDYLYINKPILNIASHQKDSSWEFLQKSPLALNAVIDPEDDINEDIKNSVKEFLLSPPASLPEDKLDEITSRYTATRIAADYFRHLR